MIWRHCGRKPIGRRKATLLIEATLLGMLLICDTTEMKIYPLPGAVTATILLLLPPARAAVNDAVLCAENAMSADSGSSILNC